MRKALFSVALLGLISINTPQAFCCGEQEGTVTGEGMKMKQMHHMMGMGGKPEMVASSDGGVIVLSGNKLYKYDKNLNLIKEVEIKTQSMPKPPASQESQEKKSKDDSSEKQ